MATAKQNLLLPAYLGLDGGLYIARAVQVLCLCTGAELCRALGLQGDIGVAAHLALFHVTVADAGVGSQQAQCLQKGDGLVGVGQARRGDDFR